jgi:hypothetical protein
MKRLLKKYDNYFFDKGKMELSHWNGHVHELKYDDENGYYYRIMDENGRFDNVRLVSILLELEDLDYELKIRYLDGDNKNVVLDNIEFETLNLKRKYKRNTNPVKVKTYKEIKPKKIKTKSEVEKPIYGLVYHKNNKKELLFYTRRSCNRRHIVNYQRLVLNKGRISLYESILMDKTQPILDFPEEITQYTTFTFNLLTKYKFRKYTPTPEELEFFLANEQGRGIIKSKF